MMGLTSSSKIDEYGHRATAKAKATLDHGAIFFVYVE